MDIREGSSPQFPARLSRRLSLVQTLILIALLIVGGLALFSAARIYGINEIINQEYEHALIIERVHLAFHEILASVHEIHLRGGAGTLERLREVEASLDRRVRAIVARQGETKVATGEEREEALVGELQRLGAAARALMTSVASSPEGSPVESGDLERLGEIAGQGAQVATQLVRIHQDGVRQLIQMGQSRLRLIIALYIGVLVVGVALVILAGVAGNRWVTAPLGRLAEAARLVADGRLDTRVMVASRTEVGQLSHAFNVMAERLQVRDNELTATQDQLRRKIRETHALYQIGGEISGLTELDPVLRWVVDKARELVGADAAVLCLVSPTGEELFIRAFSGPREMLQASGGTEHPVPLEGADHDMQAALLRVFRTGRVQAYLPAILRRAGAPIGILAIASETPREFTSDEHDLVSGLATQAAIAIENARLYEEVQRLATVEERRRLAQEVHDGLAQTIGLLHLKLRSFQENLPRTDPRAAAVAVQEITRIAESVYDEARQTIFGLRAMASRYTGLVPMLAEYLDDFRSQSGIEVTFEPGADASVRLSPTAEVQVVRIVQEALSNVRRHSGAARASVRLQREDEWVHVSVEDDGRGWDPETAQGRQKTRFGLQTMRERAQSLGGALHIDTAPGRGTRVTAKVPVEGRR